MEGDQGGSFDHLLLFELPHEAAVGIVLEARELVGHGCGMQGPEPAAVVQVQPAPALQFGQHGVPIVGVQLEDHIAKRMGLGIHLHQGPQPVVAVHHPNGPALAAHQGNGFAAQVGASFLGVFVGKIFLPALHLGHTHAQLGWLEARNRHFQQLALGIGWR